MNDVAIWGTLATVFGILIAAITELIKSFKDGAVTRGIKEDTTEMKPKVDDIKTAVSTTNTILLSTVNPAMQNMNEQTKKIDVVVNSMARFEGLVQGSKTNALRPDELLAQMKAVYDERQELLLENQALKEENNRLREENRELEQELRELEPEPPSRSHDRCR